MSWVPGIRGSGTKNPVDTVSVDGGNKSASEELVRAVTFYLLKSFRDFGLSSIDFVTHCREMFIC